jgi:hypothetical protein
MGTLSQRRLLEADHPVSGNLRLGETLGRAPRGILAFQIFVCDRTGLGTAPSDVDRDAVFNDLRQQVPKWRPAHTVDLVGHDRLFFQI